MAERDEEPPYPPRSHAHRRELWVGLFVVLALISGLIVVFTMTDPALFRGRVLVKTIVDDAGSLRKGDPVQLRGVVIGKVDAFAIDSASGRVAIALELERGHYRVPKDSRVEIRSRSIYGEKAAVIIPGRSPSDVKSGDVLQGRFVRDVFGGAAEIGEKATDVMSRMQSLLSDATLNNVAASTSELQTLLVQLNATANEQRAALQALTHSLRRSAEGLERATSAPELQAAIKRSDAVMRELEQATAALQRSSKSLETVLGRLERGEGSAGKFLTDEGLYRGLDQAVQNANRLIDDVRAHPNRYVKLSLF